MAGSFTTRIDELRRQVGNGKLTGRVVVDQVYAHYQHERLDLRHPRGGGPLYLQRGLYEQAPHYLRQLADAVLHGDLRQAMIRNMEDLSAQVERRAPVEFGDLRRSGHPQVEDDGATVYDRAPAVPRLTEEQLREKSRRRGRGIR